MFFRLSRELQALQQTMNKYIVCVFGWVKWPWSIGLVLEYMPCGNLTRFLDDDDCRSSLLLFLRIFYELASALAFIHNLPESLPLVHRDLKPENVLLTSDLHCKLSDFGSSQVAALTGSSTSDYPKSKKLDTTLAYAAPEKLKSLNITPKKEQDTYGFGMILYVILSGSRPYQHPNHEIAFIESIIRGERPDEEAINKLRNTLNETNQRILDVLQSMMRKCWAQNPLDRSKMVQVRDQLQSVLEQQRPENILVEVTQMLQSMSLTIPKKDEQQYLPLHKFVTKDQRFIQGWWLSTALWFYCWFKRVKVSLLEVTVDTWCWWRIPVTQISFWLKWLILWDVRQLYTVLTGVCWRRKGKYGWK